MTIKIILSKDNVYDIYNANTNEWLFSTNSADNVFSRLSKMPDMPIHFIDETIPKEFQHFNEKELLTCPFCGSPAAIASWGMSPFEKKYIENSDGKWYYAHCNRCYAEAYYHPSKEEAIAAWNKRVQM